MIIRVIHIIVIIVIMITITVTISNKARLLRASLCNNGAPEHSGRGGYPHTLSQ